MWFDRRSAGIFSRGLVAGLIAAAVCVPVCQAGTAAETAGVQIAPQWSRPGQAFEGWGTALAWFANVTGRMPSPTRERLADLLYGRDGLQLNIARYNIGGGAATGIEAHLRPGADIEGFWRARPDDPSNAGWNPSDETQWDWSADAGQRWWLDAIRDRVPPQNLIFEAFSNSPPYFMTVSGQVSGNTDGLQDNLLPGHERVFAQYLVRVTAELEKRHHIVLRTLSPVNEPNTPYWYAANTQEGAHWSPARQALMLHALRDELNAQGRHTEIAAFDETNAQTFVRDWSGMDKGAVDVIDQLNVHSYDTTGKTAIRDIAHVSGKRLWMSEVDLSPPNVRQDYADMRPAIALGEQIVSDINRLQPVAWVLWQAVENESRDAATSSNWGLIKMDYRETVDPRINITTKYWAMANFSRFIRPGDRFVPVDDTDTLVALKPGGKGFVVVHVNPGPYARRLAIALPRGAQNRRYRISMIVTDSAHHIAGQDLDKRQGPAALVAPPMSVATFVFTPRH